MIGSLVVVSQNARNDDSGVVALFSLGIVAVVVVFMVAFGLYERLASKRKRDK